MNSRTSEWTRALLRGFAVGNGLTMPEIQYGAYADYARGMDIVDKEAADAAAHVYPACAAKIRKCGGGGGGGGGPSRPLERFIRDCLITEYPVHDRGCPLTRSFIRSY